MAGNSKTGDRPWDGPLAASRPQPRPCAPPNPAARAASGSRNSSVTERPIWTTSPFASGMFWIDLPWKRRPFVLPRSVISHPESRRSRRAWRRDTASESTTMSLAGSRPRVRVAPRRVVSVVPPGVVTTSRAGETGAKSTVAFATPFGPATSTLSSTLSSAPPTTDPSERLWNLRAKGPISISAPSPRGCSTLTSSSTPSTRVPFPLPRSITRLPPSSESMRAWNRETVEDSRRTSFSGARPRPVTA